MSYPSDPELLVLHVLRLKGFVDVDVIAPASGQPEPVVDAALQSLSHAGYVKRREGRIGGWSLTTPGRIEGEKRLAAELDRCGCRAVVERAFEAFVAINQPFLALCTRWQLRELDGAQVVNDYHDMTYDAQLIAELDQVDDAVQPICASLAGALARFGYYNGRFAVARLRVHDGELDWFTKPMIDSYHSVWFELHENLLATLNIERLREAGVEA